MEYTSIYSKVSLKDQEYDESRKSHMLEDRLPSKAIQWNRVLV